MRRFVRSLVPLLLPVTLAAQAVPSWRVDTVRAPGPRLDFTATRGTWMNVDVSPDGRSIAFDLLGHVYELPLAGGEARALTRGSSWNMQPRYSPDGARVLFTSDRGGMNALWALTRGGDQVEQLSKGSQWTAGGSWSADGHAFFATVMDLGARFSAVRLDQWGNRLEFVRPAVFTPPTHFVEAGGKVYYSIPAGAVYAAGFQVRSYDLRTGETSTLVARPGGAFSPTLSRDGRYLAYAHRDDKATQLVLRVLGTGAERVLLPALDRDRQEAGAGTGYGAHPQMSFTPDGSEIVLARDGKLIAVHTQRGAVREIPFTAPVQRQLAQRLAFPVAVPAEGTTRTRSHRFGIAVDGGVVYEALGDLHLMAGTQRTNLTNSAAHESSPVFDPGSRTLYYATWDDDSLGAVWSRPLGGGTPQRLTTVPSQYGSLALSADGRSLAYIRGAGELQRGETTIDEQLTFDLMVRGPDGSERRVAGVSMAGSNHMGTAGQPPGVSFTPDGSRIYYTEFAGDTLYLRRVRLDGEGKETLYAFPHAVTANVSPDGRWVAFREYQRSFVTPFAFAGRTVAISAYDQLGPAFRVDANDGGYLGWSRDGARVHWTRGTGYYEKAVAEIVAARGSPTRTDLSFDFLVDRPSGTIALTNARVVTMDARRTVHERATVIITGNVISAVGPSVRVPAGARTFDLRGRTVIPGMIDAHAHYNPTLSTLHTVEQRHQGLLANLAYGTTTMYEVYGNVYKDFLVSDLQRSGAIPGARLFSTGNPIYGLRTYRPKIFRPITSLADAEEIVRFNKDHGATALKDYVQFGRAARQQLYEAARSMGVNVVAETAVDPPMNFTMLLDGVSGLEHTIGLTPIQDDVTRLWAASGAGNTPTLIVSYNGPQGETLYRQSERLWEDPKVLQFFRRDQMLAGRRPTHFFDDDIYAVEMAAELKKLAAAGVSLQGSGHGQQHGLDKHWELELFVKGGFSALDALTFATISSARYLGLDRQLGSLEAGKLADLVILEANPLVDIRNSRRIDRVMLNGVLYSGKDAARVFPDPRPARPMYFQR
ncbi:MAG: PD40 domain-containing protein [Gemmatimonadetes bacterium]|nr:PD40 domain-containing protein [Gemmatimonadota bacterium]